MRHATDEKQRIRQARATLKELGDSEVFGKLIVAFVDGVIHDTKRTLLRFALNVGKHILRLENRISGRRGEVERVKSDRLRLARNAQARP